MRSHIILSLPLLAAVASAHAGQLATLTVSQDANSGGDMALGDGSYTPMPVFDTALGTLQSVTISYDAILNWSEPLQINTPPGDWTVIPTVAGVRFFGAGGVAEIDDANPATWVITAPTTGFVGSGRISGSFTDWGALYTNPGDPFELQIVPFGFVDLANCDGFCQVDYEDDAFGIVDGTLTTTFTYIDPPAQGVPEPPAGAPLIAGALALWLARRVKRITKF